EHAFLLAIGFQEGWRSIRLELGFRDFELRDEILELRESLRQAGIDVLYYEDRFRDSFGALMEAHFRNWWFGSYRPNLEREAPLPVLIAVDTSQNRVVGFTGFVRVGSGGRAGFSPGVDPAYRGRGIGKVLANLWATDVKQQGAVESVIGTGVNNTPAKSVYFGMGYRQTAEFFTKLVKPLGTTVS
ncbi:MAG: GNAT family N-acetyltransferase, partial [Candidatus Latescibacteria bacterium]|nr:GNAT family N-acetyltransferase [Candidatus Latescibacterota bacterium]